MRASNPMRVAAVAVGLAAASLAAVPAVGAGRTGPVIKSFSPLSGVIGTRIQIKGSGFSRVRAVEFGGSRAAFRVHGAGKITASIPAAASSGRITVVTRSGAARSSRTFVVRAGLRLSASGGPPDSPATVQGAGFGSALDDVHSPAVVVGGVVYDTTDGGYVFALNASTGAKCRPSPTASSTWAASAAG